jgi:lipopolysaccharide assembly protein A
MPETAGKSNSVGAFVRARWLPILLGIVIIVFIAQNHNRASIDLFTVHLKAPLWLILLVTTAVGILIGGLLMRRRLKQSAAPTES